MSLGMIDTLRVGAKMKTARRVIARIKPIAAPAEVRDRYGALVFRCGVAAWFVLQLFLVGKPLLRSIPAIPDDAYTYLFEGVLWDLRSSAEPPAMADLRQQSSHPTDDVNVLWQQQRADARFVTPTYFFWGFVYSAIHATGLTWEQTWVVATLVGTLILGIGTALFMRSLFSPAATGIAMVLIVCQPFPMHGLHYIIPWNVCLGLALWTWGLQIRAHGYSPFGMVLGTSLMLLSHPMGLILTSVTIALSVLIGGWPRMRSQWLSLAGIVAAIVISGLAQFVLNVGGEYAETRPVGFTVLGGIWANVKEAWVGCWAWLAIFGWLLPAAIWGFIEDGVPRRRIGVLLLLVTGLLLASLFYLQPRYPADLFRRIQPVFAFIVTGLASVGIWRLVRRCASLLRRLRAATGSPQRGRTAVSLSFALVLLLLVFPVPAVRGFVVLNDKVNYLSHREDYLIRSEQVDLLLSLTKPSDRIFYNDEIVLPFCLSRGTLSRGCAYHFPLRYLPNGDALLSELDPTFGMILHPVQLSWHQEHGPVLRPGNNPLHILAQSGKPPRQLRVLVEGAPAGTQINVAPFAPNGSRREDLAVVLPVPADELVWLTVDLKNSFDDLHVDLRWKDDHHRAAIRGLRIGDGPHLWPWTDEVNLVYTAFDNPAQHVLSFDPQQLVPPGLRDRKVRVLDDQGSTLLLSLQR